jgi:hypothetical protein
MKGVREWNECINKGKDNVICEGNGSLYLEKNPEEGCIAVLLKYVFAKFNSYY